MLYTACRTEAHAKRLQIFDTWAICFDQVLEDRLSKHEWLAGDQYSIADMANFCWVCVGPFAGEPSKSPLKLLVEDEF